MLTYLNYAYFFVALVYLGLGIAILLRDVRSTLNRVGFGVFLCFSLWGFADTFVYNVHVTKGIAELFENIASIGWLLFGFFFLWFSVLFTRNEKLSKSPLFLISSFIIPAILIYKQWSTGSLIHDHVLKCYGWVGLWQHSLWTYLFFCYYLFGCAFGLFLILKYGINSKDALIKRQALVLVVTAFISFVCGTLSNIILIQFNQLSLPPMGDIIVLVWAGGMSYAMFRYRLMSITPVIAAEKIISAMKDLLFLLSPKGLIISCNRAALNTLGYPISEIEGRSIEALFTGEEPARHELLQTIKHSPLHEFETDLLKKNGKLLPVSLSTSLLRGQGIVFIAHDNSDHRLRTMTLSEAKSQLEAEITERTEELNVTNVKLQREVNERKEAVEALKASEERFRLLFERAPTGFYMSDLQGTFIEGNREAERITGFAKEDLIGKSFLSLDLLSPSQLLKASTLLTRNVLGKPTGPDEFLLKRKDGSLIAVEISTVPVKIRDRKLVLGIAHDVSQRKKSEEEKLQLEEALIHAQKMDALGRLAGGIAHDFNNLLGGIVGYADLLRMKLSAISPVEEKIARKILYIAKQASDLTSNLLAFARKGKYQVTVVDIHDVVEDVIDLLRRTVDKRIVLTSDLKASSPFVMGDRTQLQNALLNLAVNARDAMPGGGTLMFSSQLIELDNSYKGGLSFEVNPGFYLKLSVSDTGIGMDESTKARAFEPFFTTKDPGKGTGLGLASVYGTIKNHNGFIELWSEAGKGTTVTLGLPATTVVPEPMDEPEAETRILEKKTGRIMIVDDEEFIREMASDILKEMGYSVETCVNGRDAVTFYKEKYREIDLAIIDFTMPEMNGTDCFLELKIINPSIKAIIASGHSLDGEIDTLMQRGALYFLPKPFNAGQLADTVNKALSK